MSWFFSSGGQSIASLSFSIRPSNEYSELISFWMDWLDLLLDLSYKCSHAAHAFLVWPSLSLLPEASFPFRTSLGLPAPAVSSPSELVSYCFCGAHSHSPSPSSSCPQSFPASGSFQMSQLFTSRGQSIEFEQASGVGDGQRSLACCSSGGHKELDMTERLN